MLVYYYSNWSKSILFDCGQANYQFLRVKGKNLVQQDGSGFWNYSDGRGVCFSRIWDGGNGPHGPYFLWQVSF